MDRIRLENKTERRSALLGVAVLFACAPAAPAAFSRSSPAPEPPPVAHRSEGYHGGAAICRRGPDASLFSPNYRKLLHTSATWRTFPIRVYFERDANDTAAREHDAREGMDLWITAARGAVSYSVVADRSRAQVFIKFDPSMDTANTATRYRGDRLMEAHIRLGTLDTEAIDAAAMAGHEFGHALGISGHSDNQNDIMFHVHRTGEEGRITERDLNTLKSLYPAQFRARQEHPGV